MIDNICVSWTALAIVLYYTLLFFKSCSMSVRLLVKLYVNSSTKTFLSFICSMKFYAE